MTTAHRWRPEITGEPAPRDDGRDGATIRAVSPRSLAASFALATFVLVGCSPSDDDYRYRDHGRPPPACSVETTCGSCTPVLGCGWCQYEDGTGACTTSPSRCKGDTFRWSWEPSTCPAVATDAGAPDGDVIVDAGGSAPDAEDATPASDADDAAEASSDVGDAGDACVVPDGTAPCVVTTGGSLCGAGQYTLGCHPSDGAKPVPDASLSCTSALETGGSTYYCCSCAGD